jgi:hypothetical protein
MEAAAMKQVICSTGEVCNTYRDYLQSDHWDRKKILFRDAKKDPHTCFICRKTDHTDVHHRSYVNIGNESLCDLVELCRGCHAKVHDLVKNTSKYNRWRGFIDICFAVECLKKEHKKPQKTNKPKATRKGKRIAGMIFYD